jgi:DNA (cytosine-5)-methyltransferase 1
VTRAQTAAIGGCPLLDLTEAEASGWPVDPSERCDFYHRTRVLPRGVADWRKRTVGRLLKEGTPFPGVSIVESGKEVRTKLDDGISHLREIARIASLLYDSSNRSSATGISVLGVEADRVLCRLGIYRELGLAIDGVMTADRRIVFTELIPPNLRFSLQRDLTAHGKQVCRATSPSCGSCELRTFCSTYRGAEVRRIGQSDRPTAVDFFSGAGGLSEGLVRAGFRVLLALDSDPMALRTYALNHPTVPVERVLCRDIRTLRPGELRRMLGRDRVDLLAGAPPCQGFSHAGFRSKVTHTGYRLGGDERNFLFEYMVAAALELRPRMVLMENVPGMQSARNEKLSFLEAAARLLEERGGFKTVIWRTNASAYGVPQDRIRYFLIATTTGELPTRPVEDYQDHRQNFDVDALPPVTLDEAIFDLPSRVAGEGRAVEFFKREVPASEPRYRRYLTKFGILRQSRVLYNHTVRYHNERDLELYSLLRPGEDSIHILERHQRADLMRYRRDVFDDKYARLRGDLPSKTIVAHLAKDGNGYVHPKQVRSLSIREAARLQSFRDDYVFCGSPSDQWTQLGNAVPPLLAEKIAGSFLQALKRRQCL